VGYYIRVLTDRESRIATWRIQGWLDARGLADVAVAVEEGGRDAWEQVALERGQERRLATIERNPVEPGSLGSDEIQEFLDALPDARPRSAAGWLARYLPRVRVIYAFQIAQSVLSRDDDADWAAIGAVQSGIRRALGGISQSDGEGFTNKEGYHILWQFADEVTGPWNTAVLTWLGRWRRFQMDLGNREHREAFISGRVPKGVRTTRGRR
jgi:hypothetical protein